MVPLKESSVDVLVCGAGSAGVSAAVAAAECGASVGVIDQNGYFGGTLVSGITGGFCGIYAAKKSPEDLPPLTIGGVGRRILEAMEQSGGLSALCSSPLFNTRRYDNCMLQLVYDRMIVRSGASPLLHTTIIDAEAEHGTVKFVEVANKSGRERIYPKFVVDATGDADILWMTGGAYRKDVTELQPASFNFKVAGVDGQGSIPNLPQLEREIAAIKAVEGGLQFSREDPMFLQAPEFGRETVCCFSRIPVDATNAEELTQAEIAGRSEVLPTLNFIRRHFPAFRNAHISELPSYIGVRETRVITGEDILTREDVVEGRRRADGIGRCGWPVERHITGKPKSELIPVSGGEGYYDIPFGAMIPKGYHNLLVAGRAVSSDRGANASVRVFGPCAEMGQAAGTAAWLFLKTGCRSVRDLDVAALREALTGYGALI